MNELIEALKTAHATTFAFYLKAHSYHWNVESDDFPMYHDFFGKLYEDAFGAVDTIAELIRTLDVYAPSSFRELMNYSVIEDSDVTVPEDEDMVSNLFRFNQITLNELTNAYKLAERFSEFGISNAIQDRIEIHKKHAWMLRSMTKGESNG